jgi:hypothetical protein
MEYIKLAVPTLVEEDEEELSGAEVRKILDPVIPTLVSLKDAVNSYTPAPASTNKTDDEILQGFLKGLF